MEIIRSGEVKHIDRIEKLCEGCNKVLVVYLRNDKIFAVDGWAAKRNRKTVVCSFCGTKYIIK